MKFRVCTGLKVHPRRGAVILGIYVQSRNYQDYHPYLLNILPKRDHYFDIPTTTVWLRFK